MRVWHVQSRAGLLAAAAFILIVGICLLWFGAITVLLGLSSESDKGANGVRVIACSAMALLWIYGGTGYLRAVLNITVTDDGMVTFERVIGSTQVDSRYIWKLEGKYHRDYDGVKVWSLRITYGRGGSERLPEFKRVSDFRDTLLAHNPTIVITGLWPMTMLPPPVDHATIQT